ncbi:MAG: DUF3179 domain-containing protein [Deltaproteobacteria bacterium]|nr:DUF3179 domain-containing protein [Deltaproteobacteria bacterium]
MVMKKLFSLSLLLLLLPFGAWAGWDFSKHAIPLEDIQSGGPPKDGIPALTEPKYVVVAKADFMRPDEQVIGVNLNGVARAYPTRILSWHELVNDRFGGLPVLVSW